MSNQYTPQLHLQFLKLGGSLITEKSLPHTPRMDVIKRLAEEIAFSCQQNPSLALVLGHGSGSFGHVPASRYGTRQGVHTDAEWQGFVEVWREAQGLNRLVIDALAEAGLPVVSLSPVASVVAEDGRVFHWDLEPINRALNAGLLPVVYGDVAWDTRRGGTILSTEDLFGFLASRLHPRRILLAGIEAGVWADYPACTHLVSKITPSTINNLASSLSGSATTDVTGGMASKVALSLEWVKAQPGMEVFIFSGEEPGLVGQALTGASVGTRISLDKFL